MHRFAELSFDPLFDLFHIVAFALADGEAALTCFVLAGWLFPLASGNAVGAGVIGARWSGGGKAGVSSVEGSAMVGVVTALLHQHHAGPIVLHVLRVTASHRRP